MADFTIKEDMETIINLWAENMNAKADSPLGKKKVGELHEQIEQYKELYNVPFLELFQGEDGEFYIIREKEIE